MRNPKLSNEQRAALAILEPMLKSAADARDYERAKGITLKIQNILRPTGNEIRLMQLRTVYLKLQWNPATSASQFRDSPVLDKKFQSARDCT